jgi:hypothetical protein
VEKSFIYLGKSIVGDGGGRLKEKIERERQVFSCMRVTSIETLK